MLPIIWEGYGWIIAVIVFGFALLMELAVETITGDNQYYQNHPWCLFVALEAAAIATALFWWSIHDPKQQRTVRDEETGERFVLVQQKHSLFFIPMKFWPIILAILGLVGFFIP